MAKWVTDFRHLPPADAPDVPAAAARRATFVREVVEVGTAMWQFDERWLSALRCIAERDGHECGGWIEVECPDEAYTVLWRCTTCGDEGVVTEFADGAYDLSQYMPILGEPDVVEWRIDERERALLWRASVESPSIRAVIARASPVPERPGVFAIEAHQAELEDISMLVDELIDGARDRRGRDLLGGLRASLSAAFEGL